MTLQEAFQKFPEQWHHYVMICASEICLNGAGGKYGGFACSHGAQLWTEKEHKIRM
jgi:hypothetical protein